MDLHYSQIFDTTPELNYRLSKHTKQTLIVVLQQHLQYSRASQQSPTLRLQDTSVHNELQDRTLQQSVLLPATTERRPNRTAMGLLR
jgi:hypothetical protein